MSNDNTTPLPPSNGDPTNNGDTPKIQLTLFVQPPDGFSPTFVLGWWHDGRLAQLWVNSEDMQNPASRCWVVIGQIPPPPREKKERSRIIRPTIG